MTVFYLVRHALHELGPETLAGRTPGVHLSPAGREQLGPLCERLAPIPLTAVYCSPLERTRETAEAICSGTGLKPQVCEEIIELDFGDWMGEEFETLREDRRWQRFNSFRSGTRPPNGELMLETQCRVVRLMTELREKHPGESVALVTHGDVIRSAVAYAMGIPLDLFLRFEISTASVSVVAISDDGPWVLGVNLTDSLPRIQQA